MTTDVTGVRVLRCRSGSVEWAVAEPDAREVVAAVPATRIPGAPDGVIGVANLRGALLTVLDTRRLLGQPAGAEPGAMILVEVGGRRVALAVDAVDDLYTVPMEAFSLAPAVGGVPAEVVISQGRADRPFLLLDVEALIAPIFLARPGQA